jgi:hypothetical protein
MIEGFQTVLAASERDRRDLFVGASTRLGTAEQNIEKDFWVCWTLDALFNELEIGGPRLLFKGGTSLSKGYGLIERFSEDIDITVFREDIGQPATFEELEAMSGKKRNARLEAIKAACQEYIQGSMLERLSVLLQQTLKTANMNSIGREWNPIPMTPTVRACCSGIPRRPQTEMLTSVALSRSNRVRNRLLILIRRWS